MNEPVGFWHSLREWSPVFLPILTAVVTVMGFWIRAELFKKMVEFQEKYLEPLSEKLDREIEGLAKAIDQQGRAHERSLLELQAATNFLKTTLESIKTTADQLNAGSIAAAITLGRHDEQIVTLLRRYDRVEQKVEMIEHTRERRRDT